jgi:hypothetical protein
MLLRKLQKLYQIKNKELYKQVLQIFIEFKKAS